MTLQHEDPTCTPSASLSRRATARHYEWLCSSCEQERREHRLHRKPRGLEWAEVGEAFHTYIFELGGELIVTCNRHGTPIFRVALCDVQLEDVARMGTR